MLQQARAYTAETERERYSAAGVREKSTYLLFDECKQY